MWKNNSFCASFYLNELRYVPEEKTLYECVFLCATVCLLEILQKLCHLVIHLLIISHTVREKSAVYSASLDSNQIRSAVCLI